MAKRAKEPRLPLRKRGSPVIYAVTERRTAFFIFLYGSLRNSIYRRKSSISAAAAVPSPTGAPSITEPNWYTQQTYPISKYILIKDCKPEPLSGLHLLGHGRNGGKARRIQKVEHKEGKCCRHIGNQLWMAAPTTAVSSTMDSSTLARTPMVVTMASLAETGKWKPPPAARSQSPAARRSRRWRRPEGP